MENSSAPQAVQDEAEAAYKAAWGRLSITEPLIVINACY